MHQLRKATPARLFFVYTVICTASNFVHPVTPTLFQMLDFPSYMFGAAFSAMSLANFLFSPYWGYLSDRHGRRLTMILGMAIYTAGQLAFAMATTVTGVLLARVLAGVGSAATWRSLWPIWSTSPPPSKGENIWPTSWPFSRSRALRAT